MSVCCTHPQRLTPEVKSQPPGGIDFFLLPLLKKKDKFSYLNLSLISEIVRVVVLFYVVARSCVNRALLTKETSHTEVHLLGLEALRSHISFDTMEIFLLLFLRRVHFCDLRLDSARLEGRIALFQSLPARLLLRNEASDSLASMLLLIFVLSPFIILYLFQFV